MNRLPTSDPAVRTLALVRVVILAGVLTAGGAIWGLQRGTSWAPAPPEFPVRPIALGLWIAAIVGLLFVRYQWGRERVVKKRVHLSIIAIAIAEAPTLYGAVVYYFTGDPKLYLTGIFLMLTTLLIFPIAGHR